MHFFKQFQILLQCRTMGHCKVDWKLMLLVLDTYVHQCVSWEGTHFLGPSSWLYYIISQRNMRAHIILEWLGQCDSGKIFLLKVHSSNLWFQWFYHDIYIWLWIKSNDEILMQLIIDITFTRVSVSSIHKWALCVYLVCPIQEQRI